ncbi:hypothetical protein [Methylocella sp.]|uniref:hypothetical protein n=1 Tax=Methylocella sp. TaxID=1978226 RepID=UPI0037839BEE
MSEDSEALARALRQGWLEKLGDMYAGGAPKSKVLEAMLSVQLACAAREDGAAATIRRLRRLADAMEAAQWRKWCGEDFSPEAFD